MLHFYLFLPFVNLFFLGENNVRWYKDDTVVWDFNNSNLQLPSNMQIFANQTLELSDLRALDAGDYTCQVIRPDPWGPINQVHSIEVLCKYIYF